MKLRMALAAAGVFLTLGTACAEVVPGPDGLSYERKEYRDTAYDVVWVDPSVADLRLYWKNAAGERYGNFDKLREAVESAGEQLLFAINSGIYARDYTPLGLHVEKGEILEPLNRKEGGGNFFLRPNGVFYVIDGKAAVLETERFYDKKMTPPFAVQSGPMLALDGKPHPKFQPDSDSVHVRNGVGVSEEGRVAFAISNKTVNLHTFASFFIEALDCPNALYLDGALSGMYAPFAKRTDFGVDYVGMIAVVGKEEPAADGEK